MEVMAILRRAPKEKKANLNRDNMERRSSSIGTRRGDGHLQKEHHGGYDHSQQKHDGGDYPLHEHHGGWYTSSAGIRGPRPAMGSGKEIEADIAVRKIL